MDTIYAYIKLLFANFFYAENVAYMQLPFNDIRYWPHASSNVNYSLFVADVKCGLYEINKTNRANATHVPSPVQKLFREVMLDWIGPGRGPEVTRSNTKLHQQLQRHKREQFICSCYTAVAD